MDLTSLTASHWSATTADLFSGVQLSLFMALLQAPQEEWDRLWMCCLFRPRRAAVRSALGEPPAVGMLSGLPSAHAGCGCAVQGA